jgi:hypothetical protein
VAAAPGAALFDHLVGAGEQCDEVARSDAHCYVAGCGVDCHAINFQPSGVFVQALRNTSLRLRGWPLISASIEARPVTSAVSPARRTLRSLQVALLYFVFPERREASHVALVSGALMNGYREARREASPRAQRNRRRTSPHSACPRGRGFPCRCSSPDLPCCQLAWRPHSITSPARASNFAGRPSLFAALRLITSSNLVGTFKNPGLTAV